MNLEFLTYTIFLSCALLLVYSILFGSILKSYYFGEKKFKFLLNFFLLFSEISTSIFFYLKKLPLVGYFKQTKKLSKHKVAPNI